jgi:formylglycine-generating enzyme required for sulfatase activity
MGQAEKLRGGSWINNPNNCRSACRNRNNTDNHNNNYGFRVVYSRASTLQFVRTDECNDSLGVPRRVQPCSGDAPISKDFNIGGCGIQRSIRGRSLGKLRPNSALPHLPRLLANSMPESTESLLIDRTSHIIHTFTEDLGNDLLLNMALIPPGEFMMGSPTDETGHRDNESPEHLVKIHQPFGMGQYPVTQAQWARVAKMKKIDRRLKSNPSHFEGDNLPVENISWLEAQEFCARLSAHTKYQGYYRLPSEAEWEYACRAGTTTPFHFGETIDAELANYQAEDEKIGDTVYPGKYGRGQFGNYPKKTTPVGSFGVSNNFGLYDMHGNVWEWCADHWHDSYQGAPEDGTAWIDKKAKDNASRILRGGSWFDGPNYCRSACRFRNGTDLLNFYYGFRVVYSRARTS